MFFAPPQVKSLSRYSEFGTYLHFRHFLIMVAVAMALHGSILGFYAMLPREEVVKIPVRVLNIKLGGGGVEIEQPVAPTVSTPAPEKMTLADNNQPQSKDVREEQKVTPAEEKPSKVESVVDKATAKQPAKPAIHPQEYTEKSHHAPASDTPRNASAEHTLSTPKRYVREADRSAQAGGKAGGKSGSRMGTATGEEIIERYEQTISLWIASHKIYPDSAKRQGIEGDAVVRIRINREGHILYNSIDRSSGNALIDEAVISMVRASDPVPAVPNDYPTANQLEFLIPVSFRLQ